MVGMVGMVGMIRVVGMVVIGIVGGNVIRDVYSKIKERRSDEPKILWLKV